jgi:hypothetical protein
MNLHRKNGAEWLMWIALWPIAVAMRLWSTLAESRNGATHGQR